MPSHVNTKLLGGRGLHSDQQGYLDALASRAREVDPFQQFVVVPGIDFPSTAATVTVSTSILRFVPMPILSSPVQLTAAKVGVSTSQAGTTCLTGIYVYQPLSGEVSLLPGSSASFSLASVAVLSVAINCVLYPGQYYFMGFVGSGITTGRLYGGNLDTYVPVKLRGVLATSLPQAAQLRNAAIGNSGTTYPTVVYLSRLGKEFLD